MSEIFFKQAAKIAVPVAAQAMLQSSFSMIDQIMVGQLGGEQIAAVEIGGKPGFIFSCVCGAVSAVAGIMISQYLGKKDKASVDRSISVGVAVMLLIAAIFTVLCLAVPRQIAALYTKDPAVTEFAWVYIQTIAPLYLLSGTATILSVFIRCIGRASIPLFISAGAALLNTFLNWILIFGRFGSAALGVQGAALASVLSQLFCFLLMIVCFLRCGGILRFSFHLTKTEAVQYAAMLLPVVVNEFLWSVGQNVFTALYGHIGTEELAAMSLTGPLQGLFIGALSGLAQAAGILIGKRLGAEEYDKAYEESKKLCFYGFAGSLLLSVLLIATRGMYTNLYQVGDGVRRQASVVLLAFAVLAPLKVENMILGGGIIRSGGKTKYIMIIDLLGTWIIGVPVGLLAGLVFRLPLVWVYFLLSQEELARFVITVILFRKKSWMDTL